MLARCETKWHAGVYGLEEPFPSLWDRTSASKIIHLGLGSDRVPKPEYLTQPLFWSSFILLCFVQLCIIVLHVLMSRFIAMTKGSSPSGLGYLKPTMQNGSNLSRKSSWYPPSVSTPSRDNPFWAEKKLVTYLAPIKLLRPFQWWLDVWHQNFIFFQDLKCQKGKEFKHTVARSLSHQWATQHGSSWVSVKKHPTPCCCIKHSSVGI